MYCRKCGTKLNAGAICCPECGTEVLEIRQPSYSELYEENRRKEKAENRKLASFIANAADYAENRYQKPAFVTALCALALAAIPWPKAWGIGTSLWMKLLILFIGIVSVYHCVKANQISNHNRRQTEKYNRTHRDAEINYRKPAQLTAANIISVLTVLMAAFAIIG